LLFDIITKVVFKFICAMQ